MKKRFKKWKIWTFDDECFGIDLIPAMLMWNIGFIGSITALSIYLFTMIPYNELEYTKNTFALIGVIILSLIPLTNYIILIRDIIAIRHNKKLMRLKNFIEEIYERKFHYNYHKDEEIDLEHIRLSWYEKNKDKKWYKKSNEVKKND